MARSLVLASATAVAAARVRRQEASECAQHPAPGAGQGGCVVVSSKGFQVKVELNDAVLSPPATEPRTRGDGTGPLVRKAKYVVVGSGVAGRAALSKLSANEPFARTIVVDGTPKSGQAQQPQQEQLSRLGRHTQVLSGVTAHTVDTERNELMLSDGSIVQFERCLLASGAPRSGLPTEFVDKSAQKAVFSMSHPHDRTRCLRLAKHGAPVLVVGNTWAAVELASTACDAARRNGGVKPRVTLVCPDAGPLAKVLPRFLVSALVTRLRKRGITVVPYSYVRYIAAEGQGGQEDPQEEEEDDNAVEIPLVNVYTCRTFDSLDTGIHEVTHVSVGDNIPTAMPAIEGLEVHPDLGGIMVNQELMASSRVWCAGDVSVFPHFGELGHAGGRGVDHAFHSGIVAAANMLGQHIKYTHMPVYRIHHPPLGLHAVSIGLCDADAETHTFVWRPQTAHRRHKTTDATTDEASGPSSSPQTPQSNTAEPAAAASASQVATSVLQSLRAVVGQTQPTQPGPSHDGSLADDDEAQALHATFAELSAAEKRRLSKHKPAPSIAGSGMVFYVDPTRTRVTGVVLWGAASPAATAAAAQLPEDRPCLDLARHLICSSDKIAAVHAQQQGGRRDAFLVNWFVELRQVARHMHAMQTNRDDSDAVREPMYQYAPAKQYGAAMRDTQGGKPKLAWVPGFAASRDLPCNHGGFGRVKKRIDEIMLERGESPEMEAFWGNTNEDLLSGIGDFVKGTADRAAAVAATATATAAATPAAASDSAPPTTK